MSPKKSTALRLDVELLDAMGKIRKAEGIPVTTQIEFAIREWLQNRGTLTTLYRRDRSKLPAFLKTVLLGDEYVIPEAIDPAKKQGSLPKGKKR